MELQIIQHNDILFGDVLRAISLKSVAWPYPVESQVKWIIDNMRIDDMHVFLIDAGKDLAYMTLSPVKGWVNGSLVSFYGVGCVCSANPGRGYGKMLIKSVNEYLLNNNCRGLLFCKKDLMGFYGKYNWELVHPNKIHFTTPHEGVFTMVYNCETIDELGYSDRFI